MALLPPSDFYTQTRPLRGTVGGRLLGIDVGEKRVGLALSDPTWTIASPFIVLHRNQFGPLAQKIKHLVEMHHVGGLIFGWPVQLDGQEGIAVQRVRHFAYNLSSFLSLPMGYWDERFSTAFVDRMMIEADVSRAHRHEIVDKLAAAYILQGFLEYIRELEVPSPPDIFSKT